MHPSFCAFPLRQRKLLARPGVTWTIYKVHLNKLSQQRAVWRTKRDQKWMQVRMRDL